MCLLFRALIFRDHGFCHLGIKGLFSKWFSEPLSLRGANTRPNCAKELKGDAGSDGTPFEVGPRRSWLFASEAEMMRCFHTADRESAGRLSLSVLRNVSDVISDHQCWGHNFYLMENDAFCNLQITTSPHIYIRVKILSCRDGIRDVFTGSESNTWVIKVLIELLYPVSSRWPDGRWLKHFSFSVYDVPLKSSVLN